MIINESFLGKNVIIKRSSGAKQNGWISKIDEINKCVLVEWEENSQAKAKEVSFEQLLAWNKELFNHQPQTIATSPTTTRKLDIGSVDINENINKQRPQLQRGFNHRKTTVFTKGITSPPSNKRKATTNNQESRENKPLNNNNNRSPVKTKTYAYDRQSVTNQQCDIPKSRHYPRNSIFSQKNLATTDKNPKIVNIPIEIEDDNISPTSQHYPFYTMIKEYRENMDLKPIGYGDDSILKNIQICVCIRKRPLNIKETTNKEIDIVTMTSKQQTLVHECRHKVDMTKYLENHDFCFDYCFNEYCDNATIYKYTTKPLVDCIFDGGMATCFAYGQTGSGKTYTMGGNYFTDNINGIDEEKGIYDHASKEIFYKIKSNPGTFLTISVYEIYGTKVLDLLNEKRILRVMEDGQGSVKVCELKEMFVSSEKEIQNLIRAALKIRSSGVTSANANSSRSHAIIQFSVYKREDRKRKSLLGKLSLIDLAGNERGVDTKTCDRNTRMEGAEINKSLLALKECIRALGRKNAHLPFRSSKLTQVLKDSFLHEKARTCMIATISPGITCCENTLNTLHYANRVKQLGSKNTNTQENQSKEDDNKIDDNYVELMDINSDPILSPDNNINMDKIKDDLVDDHILVVNESDNITDFEKRLIGNIDKIPLDEYLEKLDMFVSKKLNLYESLSDKMLNIKATLDEMRYHPR